MDKEILLQVHDLSVRYREMTVLDGVSLSLGEGEIVALMGPNGAGKSTVLKSIFGLAPLCGGSLLWRGAAFTPLPHQVVRRGIAFVPQGRRVFSGLSVQENLEIAGAVICDGVDMQGRIDEVMRMFPVLQERRHTLSGTLSGGQQQMLALARGLMIDPAVLLLDEPSLGLAPKVVKEIFAKMQEINENRKTAILVVEHNISSLLAIAHRAYVLDKGRIVFESAASDLQGSGVLEKVFLGTA